jgi:hypothetical protein
MMEKQEQAHPFSCNSGVIWADCVPLAALGLQKDASDAP